MPPKHIRSGQCFGEYDKTCIEQKILKVSCIAKIEGEILRIGNFSHIFILGTDCPTIRYFTAATMDCHRNRSQGSESPWRKGERPTRPSIIGGFSGYWPRTVSRSRRTWLHVVSDVHGQTEQRGSQVRPNLLAKNTSQKSIECSTTPDSNQHSRKPPNKQSRIPCSSTGSQLARERPSILKPLSALGLSVTGVKQRCEI